VYVRSLARDLAQVLGTAGHVAELRRTAVGRFTEAVAIPLDLLGDVGHIAPRLGYLQPVETALDDIPALAVTEIDCHRLRLGQAVELPRTAIFPLAGVVQATHAGRVVALATVDGASLRPIRVLNH
jgi:tRNA pseudouridine55 synthase